MDDASSNHFKTILLVDNHYVPFILVVGSVCNLLSVLVFTLSSLRHQWSSAYLAAISATRCLFVALLAISYLNTWHYIDRFSVDGWCQLETYLTRVAENLPVLLSCAFSIEALASVANPAKLVVARSGFGGVVWCSALALLVSVYVPFVTGIDEQQTSCLFLFVSSPYRVLRIFFTLDSVVAALLPTLLVVLVQAVTCVRLCCISCRQHCRRRRPPSMVEDASKHIHRTQINAEPCGNALRPAAVAKKGNSPATMVDINDWKSWQVPIVWNIEPNIRTNMLSCLLTCLFTVPYSLVRILVAWQVITSSSLILAGYALTQMLFFTQLWLPFLVHLSCDAVFRRTILCPSCGASTHYN